MRSRKAPRAEIREGHLSSRLCHMGNIATRVGRRLVFDPQTESLKGDSEASALLTRPSYRSPFEVPDPTLRKTVATLPSDEGIRFSTAEGLARLKPVLE